jgi:hypothetical protein
MNNEKFKEKVQSYKKLADEASKIIDEFNQASSKLQKLYQNNIVPYVGSAEGPYGAGNIHYIYCKETMEKEAKECGMTLDEFDFFLKNEKIWFEYDSYQFGGDKWENSSTAGC